MQQALGHRGAQSPRREYAARPRVNSKMHRNTMDRLVRTLKIDAFAIRHPDVKPARRIA